MTGRQALEFKLVDKLGGQELAMGTLREMVKADAKIPVLEGPEKKLPLLPRLLGASLSAMLQALGADASRTGAADGLTLQYRQ
jgi:protease-4